VNTLEGGSDTESGKNTRQEPLMFGQDKKKKVFLDKAIFSGDPDYQWRRISVLEWKLGGPGKSR